MTKPLAAGLVPIPQPPPYPILGNALEMDPENPMQSLVDLHKKYGPIYVFQFPGHPEIMVGSQELTHELCDQDRFKKTVGGPLGEVRQLAKDGEQSPNSTLNISDEAGLFTAHGHEPNWAIAHRILFPAFGPLSIRGMFDQMFEICSQLILKVCHSQTALWTRLKNSGLDLETPESTYVAISPKRLSTLSPSVAFPSDSTRSTPPRIMPLSLPCRRLYELAGIEPVDFLVLDGCTTAPTKKPRPTPRSFTISVMR
jgi:hypothetical protein